MYGTPDARNLELGAGEVFFSRFDASGNFTDVWRHLGNVDKFDVTPTPDTKDKLSSMTGLRALLASTVVGLATEISMELNEYDAENLALSMMGETAAFAQSSTTPTNADLNNAANMVLDAWYPLGGVNPDVDSVVQTVGAFVLTAAAAAVSGNTTYTGTITGGAGNGHKGKLATIAGFSTGGNNVAGALVISSDDTHITVVNGTGANESHAGTATLGALGTDLYDVNMSAGLIRIRSTSSIGSGAKGVATVPGKWSGTIPAYGVADNLRVVKMLTNGKIQGRLKFITARDLLAGPKYNYEWYKVQVLPDGATPLISDDYGAFTLKAKVLQDLTRTTGDQYGTVTERPAAEV